MANPSNIPEVQADEGKRRIAALNAEPVIKPGAFNFNPPRTRDPHAPNEQDRTRFEFPGQEDRKRVAQGDVTIPAGGTDGQVLTKQSDDDGDVAWEDVPLPPGYVEQSITLCIGGVNTPGKILFKPDTPPGP